MVKNPEKYRYSSMGMAVRESRRYKKMISFFEIDTVAVKQTRAFYRQFVFEMGGVKIRGKSSVPQVIIHKVLLTKGSLQLGEKLRYKCANFSEGMAFGSKSFIESLQEEWGRRFIRPRPLGGNKKEKQTEQALFAMRVLN